MMLDGHRQSQFLSGRLLLAVVFVLFAVIPRNASGADTVTPASSASLKFELDIQPILTARGCNSGPCHGKSRGQNGFALSLLAFDADFDYAAIVEEARGRRLFPAAPNRSLLLQKATGQLPHGGGIRISPGDEDFQKLVAWIEGGSSRVSDSDPKLERVTIEPQAHPLVVNQTVDLNVLAHYSDGSVRNVSKTCAYLSNEPAIVSVSNVGQIRAGNIPGEATITARYMGVIATWNTAIPRPGEIPSDAFDALPRNNFIDDLVHKKLRSLNVLPSPPCNDAEFLRRAFVDCIGRLPSIAEARSFLEDNAENKREKLVDQLLEREEYADFWANKWADLLRPNPYRVGIKATLSLDTWLRDVFRQNLSYDQFVTRLLTAKGSNWHNGAVTMFRDRREPDELTTMVTRLFVGVRLECAKCHQHPFEVYSQSDFYSMAAFFSRVRFKGTGLSPPISGGEEMVFVSDSGEVRHPLTKAVLKPKPLAGPEMDIAAGDDPRQSFCDWLTKPDNPYFAKAAANRIWAEIMGKGLVDPVDDLRATNPPSNPELLDALAAEFANCNFDQKRFIKTIMMSQTYALSSLPNETNASDIRNFSRHYRRRFRAEVLLDAVSDVTEIPDRFDGAPVGTRAMQLWTFRTESQTLDAFGRPDPNQDPPCERLPDSTMVQALHLMNAGQFQGKIASDTGRVARLAASSESLEQILDELYLATFSRRPSAEEVAILMSSVQQPTPARRQWIEDVLWSLLNSPEFFHVN
jgi:Protein of unknown function (DUF1553)/Protein of unknown function (DUF1549)